MTKLLEPNDEEEFRFTNEVYVELKKIARRKMMGERVAHTLGATGLVHLVWLRLADQAYRKGRAYFFKAAAISMHRILIDHARERKRKGRDHEVDLDGVLDEIQVSNNLDFVDLHNAIEELEKLGDAGARRASVITLRFFAGAPWKETAQLLDISVATAEKDCQAARAWLRGKLD